MYVNKWLTFTAAGPVQLSSGLAYVFPLWSDVFKTTFGYTQTQVQMIGSATNFGGYSGIIAGIVYDLLGPYAKLGPRLTLLIGGCLSCAGYLGLWAALRGYVAFSYTQVLLLATLACSGGSWTDVSSIATNITNFPNQRGVVVGLMKAYVGLCASVYASMYHAFFAPNATSFLLFLAFAPLATALAAAPLFNKVPFVQRSEMEASGWMTSERRFALVSQAVAALALFQLVAALMRTVGSSSGARWLGLGTLLLLLPLLVPSVRSGGLFAQPADALQLSVGAASRKRSPSAGRPLSQPLVDAGGEPSWEPQGAKRLRRVRSVVEAMPDLGPARCLLSGRFWLMFACTIVLCGSGLMLLNNLAQLVVALGGDRQQAGAYTGVYSVMNCGGRLLVGYVSEHMLHTRGTARPVFLIAMCLLSALAMGLAAATGLASLFLIVIIMSIAFGGTWALMPALASELFGLRHFATNYCFIQLAPALGGLALATNLAGRVYQWEGQRHGDPSNTCVGDDCYRLAFVVACGLNLLAAACAAILYYDTRQIYRIEYEAVHEYDVATHQVGEGEGSLRGHRDAGAVAASEPVGRGV